MINGLGCGTIFLSHRDCDSTMHCCEHLYAGRYLGGQKVVRTEYVGLMSGLAIAVTCFIFSNGQLLFWGILGGAAFAAVWLIIGRLIAYHGWVDSVPAHAGRARLGFYDI